MTTLMIQTETTNRRRNVVDVVENAYLHFVRFLYGAWTSPFVWFIFGILIIIQHPQTWWMSYARDIATVACIANFGRLWEWHNALRKEHVKNIVAAAKNNTAS